MKENELNINELIKVKQLPKIFSQLEIIGEAIDKKLEGIDDLKCTEENKKEVKNRRTEINNMKKIMEDKRKEIKNAIMKKYDIFNEKYEEEVKTKLENAINILTKKIDFIEIQQKEDKKETIKEFADEYIKSKNLGNLVTFEQLNINITLSASEKSLKDEVLRKLEKIETDLKLIKLEENYSDEILIEYKKNFDLTKSKLEVINRHKQLEKLQQEKSEIQLKIDEEDNIVESIDEIVAPKEIDEELITVSFTITDTKDRIKEIKEFLIKGGYDYE